MKLVISINIGGLAFGDNDLDAAAEVARIVEQLEEADFYDVLSTGRRTLFDSNGNKVGFIAEE